VLRTLSLVVALGACVNQPNDVVGPFTGSTHRYVVDSIVLPSSQETVRHFAADLDGNGIPDNQLGTTLRTMASYSNLTPRGHDMIVAGAISSSVEIVADRLDDDATVSVRYIGADGAPSTGVGGRFEDGRFHSNRTAWTDVPGATELHLPVFLEADPSIVPLAGMEIDLFPDGSDGYIAWIRGGIPVDEARFAAADGIVQMVASDPGEHLIMVDLFDASPRDGVLTREEILGSSLFVALLAPDVTIDGVPTVSLGFEVHLRPCESGTCLENEVFERCFDRIQDGDESDIDCGGQCRGCEADAICTAASDCETASCTDAGVCGPPSCSNGVRDGLEMGVDCGQDCETRCATGERCYENSDCATGQCGPPPPPCPPDAWLCWDAPMYSTCQ
jgi:hypothetical protein